MFKFTHGSLIAAALCYGGTTLAQPVPATVMSGRYHVNGGLSLNPSTFSNLNQGAALNVFEQQGNGTPAAGTAINLANTATYYPADIAMFLQGGTNAAYEARTASSPGFVFGNPLTPRYPNPNRIYFTTPLTLSAREYLKPGAWIVVSETGTGSSQTKALVVAADTEAGAFIETAGWSVKGSAEKNQVPAALSGTQRLLIGASGSIFGANWIETLGDATSSPEQFLQLAEFDLNNQSGGYDAATDTPHVAGIDIFSHLVPGNASVSHMYGEGGPTEDAYVSGGATFAGFLYDHNVAESARDSTAFLAQYNSTGEGGPYAFRSESIPSSGVGHTHGAANFTVDAYDGRIDIGEQAGAGTNAVLSFHSSGSPVNNPDASLIVTEGSLAMKGRGVLTIVAGVTRVPGPLYAAGSMGLGYGMASPPNNGTFTAGPATSVTYVSGSGSFSSLLMQIGTPVLDGQVFYVHYQNAVRRLVTQAPPGYALDGAFKSKRAAGETEMVQCRAYDNKCVQLQ